MNKELKIEFQNNLINKINSKTYINKDKNKIKRFLIKIQRKNQINDYNTDNNNFLFINNNNNNISFLNSSKNINESEEDEN